MGDGWNSWAGSISAMTMLTSRRAGFISTPGSGSLFASCKEAIHEFSGNQRTVRPAGQRWNTVAVFHFKGLWLQRLAQKSGHDTASSGFALLGDLLDGEKEFIVDVRCSAHRTMIASDA